MSQTSHSARCGIREYLAEQHRRGILNVPDAELTAMQFVGMIKGPFFLAALVGAAPHPGDAAIETAVNTAVDIFLSGVAVPGATQ